MAVREGLPKMNGLQIVRVEIKSVMAPCVLGKGAGSVVTIDNDNKDGLCVCAANPQGCRVDGRNMVIQDKYAIVSYN